MRHRRRADAAKRRDLVWPGVSVEADHDDRSVCGGPANTLARLLGERMKTSLGQPIVIENVAGAAGSTGVGRLVRAPADGTTIGIGHLGTNVFNGALYNLQYDLVKDLEPIALLPSN